jgi:hypothetical protein
MDPWGAPLTIENEYPINTSTNVERPPVCLRVDVAGYAPGQVQMAQSYHNGSCVGRTR